ncbi:hypothetical protein DXG01_016633 [Tephrocybe rancida]|nr:hypothetical protein DXG01_016633 [Tephrocybe rancida]
MANTPFIPPLPHLVSQGNTPAAPNPPVIPDPPVEPGNLGWGGRPQHGGGFPGHYPSSPYTGPGFIPPTYPTPHNPNANLPPIRPGPAEYSGYPGMQAPPPHMQGPWSAPVQPTPGWGPMRPPQGYYQQPPHNPYQSFATPYPQQPQSAWPGAPPHGYGGGAPAGWGNPVNPGPPPQMHYTPAPQPTPGFPGPFLNFDAWNMPQGGPPPQWPNQQPAGPAGRGELPEYLHVGRSNARVGDRVDKFMAGSSYGIVLDAFETVLLGATTEVNPLLEPLPEEGDRPHLRWNMLFRSNDCTRSTDESHISWSKGRDEPATFPRILTMNIISESFPWSIEVKAGNAAVGVTCGEVIEALATNFYHLAKGADYESLDSRKKAEVAAVYRQNRSREPGVPGGILKDGMRRLDFLGKDIIYGGIFRDDQKVFKLLGTVPPCTFILKCLKQYALLPQEAHEYEEKKKAMEERELEEARRRAEDLRHRDIAEARQRQHRATVEDDFGSEDSDDGSPD